MTHYFIEFRFQGKARYEMKKMIYEIDRKFNLNHVRKKRPIPHVTIVAPFYTNNQKQLVRDFRDVCEKYSPIKFKIGGYGHFKNSKVVYVDIKPSEKLIEFRKDLIKKIRRYSTLKDYDSGDMYKPHATIAMKLDNHQFDKIRDYVLRKREFSKDYLMVRATLIKGNRILCEYDFLLKRLLKRSEAKSKVLYSKTIDKLRNSNNNFGLLDKIKRGFGLK